MADNVAITAGAGTTLASDDIGGVQYPRAKLSLGADGSAVDAVAGAGAVSTGVQRVTLASDDPAVVALQATNTQLNWGFSVAVAPTVTAGAYSANDIVGGLLNFANCARANDETLIITSVVVALKAAVTSTLTLVLFSSDPTATTQTDNAAYSLNAADVFKAITNLTGFTLSDQGTPNVYELRGLSIACKPVSGARNIYGLLIDGTGFTLTSTSDVQVRLNGLGA